MASWKLPLVSGVDMPNRYFATQYREEIPIIPFALTSMNGEYIEVGSMFANEYLGPGWYQPFDDEIGLYSGIGTDDEQENDKLEDDLLIRYKDVGEKLSSWAREQFPHLYQSEEGSE
jgi:hypothetical protein